MARLFGAAPLRKLLVQAPILLEVLPFPGETLQHVCISVEFYRFPPRKTVRIEEYRPLLVLPFSLYLGPHRRGSAVMICWCA